MALSAQRRGFQVALCDPAPPGANASAIAAGMLAPALEAALDPASRGRFALLARARDLWPAFAAPLAPLRPERCGALMQGPAETLAATGARLSEEGAAWSMTAGQLFTPEDWRIEPRLALAAMRRAVVEGGGRIIARSVVRAEADAVWLDDGERAPAAGVVLACGYGALGLTDELGGLTPVKGQLLRYETEGYGEGPILREAGAYLAPGREGPAVGATMAEGQSDLSPDPDATERLKAAAARLAPSLAAAPFRIEVGVRAASADGLPLIGRSSSGVWLAAAARRNGWLLAPLAGALIADGLEGASDDPLFNPVRFSRTG